MAPQDLSYPGEPTRLEIGDHNQIREFVTISRGTVKGGGITRVGSHTLIMAYVHIAHDCVIGDHVIMANAATLGGHITVGDWAQVGALCPIHHFVRIGAYSFIGGGTTVTKDVLPFSKTVAARDTHAYGLNVGSNAAASPANEFARFITLTRFCWPQSSTLHKLWKNSRRSRIAEKT